MWWVTPDSFYLQMLDLQSRKVVYLDDYDPSDPDQYVITFDGVYENVGKYAAPILKHFGYPFELFITGAYIGKGNEFDEGEPYAPFASRDTLQELVKAGGRLQWHTWSHPVLVGPQTDEAYLRELPVPEDLRPLDPAGFGWFAYPHGRRDDMLKEKTRQYYRGALACDDGTPSDLFDLPRLTVTEETRFQKATVSLIIACYNYGHLAAEAIESALLQTCPADEILFIDDASTDNSVEVARRYEPRIRVEVNPENLGIVRNFKKAVDLTHGDYICFLGADNRFRSDYIEKCKAVLDSNPEVGIAYSNFVLFGDRAALVSTRMQEVRPHPFERDIFFKDFPASPAKPLRQENYIHGSSMYRRVAYEQAGGYANENIPEDMSLFARILEAGWKAKLVDDYILEYRQHSRNQQNMLKSLEFENTQLRSQVKDLIGHLSRKDQALQAASQQLTEIQVSKAWRLVQFLRRLRLRLIPPGSTRERFALIFLNILRRFRKS
jgi:glycosyltransferase involved in cell wall biosynthesis